MYVSIKRELGPTKTVQKIIDQSAKGVLLVRIWKSEIQYQYHIWKNNLSNLMLRITSFSCYFQVMNRMILIEGIIDFDCYHKCL